ncbi:hypothetical protein EZV62_003662 [Acer yangbiense]|uniref:Serine-threonine/tyrosine-protein kinase catalytic domain-containing protein n=1 Tax=Acer yangbiense TaxID=1000413 RepID=A0A5C7IHD0_9ROSI|nr:hypothetical protein EZV62_003662 [Acer yangbiense]
MIASKPAIEKSIDKTHIIQWVSFMLAKGDIRNVVDPRLQGDFSMNSVWEAIELAMACVSQSSAKRPTMKQVALSQCNTSANLLSWERKLQIATEAAQGLESLHSGCYKDVKSTNIFLNEKLEAKLADLFESSHTKSFPLSQVTSLLNSRARAASPSPSQLSPATVTFSAADTVTTACREPPIPHAVSQASPTAPDSAPDASHVAPDSPAAASELGPATSPPSIVLMGPDFHTMVSMTQRYNPWYGSKYGEVCFEVWVCHYLTSLYSFYLKHPHSAIGQKKKPSREDDMGYEGSSTADILSCGGRIRIATETAQGLEYLHSGYIKNIVDPRLQGDYDTNSVWRAVEVAMACVSQSSAKRPTMNQVVIDLNESLAIEIARTNVGRETESRSISLNLHSELLPLAR